MEGREGLTSRFTFHVSHLTHHAPGFTLLELLVAVSIMIIIGGAAYTTFNMAIDVYQKSESRIVMNQKCRIALDRVATDLSNLQTVQGDESLIIVSQDNPGEDGGERDVISFVTLIHTDPDPFLAQLNLSGQTMLTDEEENQAGFVSDVQRVAYYIGEDPSQQVEFSEIPGIRSREADSEVRGPILTDSGEEVQHPALLRLATIALDPEIVIQPMLESGIPPTEDEDGNPIHINIAPIIDQIVSFDVKYFDGEKWYDSWEDTETIPKSVQVWITVADENGQRRQNTPSARLTQSTMIYLLMSANFSEQPPGGGPAGVPGG